MQMAGWRGRHQLHALEGVLGRGGAREEVWHIPRREGPELHGCFGLAALDRERHVHHVSAGEEVAPHLGDHEREHRADDLGVLDVGAANAA